AATGCAPQPAPSPLPIVSPPPPPPVAQLAVENFSVEVRPPGGIYKDYSYGVRFQLRETSGISGATILEVTGTTTSGFSESGCDGGYGRIPPGGVFDEFSTYEKQGYCHVSPSSPSLEWDITLRVTYADDA